MDMVGVVGWWWLMDSWWISIEDKLDVVMVIGMVVGMIMHNWLIHLSCGLAKPTANPMVTLLVLVKVFSQKTKELKRCVVTSKVLFSHSWGAFSAQLRCILWIYQNLVAIRWSKMSCLWDIKSFINHTESWWLVTLLYLTFQKDLRSSNEICELMKYISIMSQLDKMSQSTQKLWKILEKRWICPPWILSENMQHSIALPQNHT